MKLNVRSFTEPKLESVISTVMAADWKNERVYGDFLAQIHYYILHTTRLLALAGSRFSFERQELHQTCLKHAAEEKNHELLSLSDLKEIGYKATDFTELPSTKALYRGVYYLVEHENPISILGYAYFLECLAVKGGERILSVVEPYYGKKATKHLHVHAKEDPAHIEMVEKILAGLPESDLEAVMEAVAVTASEFERVVLEVGQRSGARPSHLRRVA